jgi:hypothetical protein
MFQYMQSLDATHGFAPPPSLFPPVDPAQFHTPVSIKILVLHDIYSYIITHAISSLCRAIWGSIQQPSWIAQHIAALVQPPTSLRYFVHMILSLLVLLIHCEITWSKLVDVGNAL